MIPTTLLAHGLQRLNHFHSFQTKAKISAEENTLHYLYICKTVFEKLLILVFYLYQSPINSRWGVDSVPEETGWVG